MAVGRNIKQSIAVVDSPGNRGGYNNNNNVAFRAGMALHETKDLSGLFIYNTHMVFFRLDLGPSGKGARATLAKQF